MSNDDKLVSLSGAPIFRYTEGPRDWEPPRGEECLEAISAHIGRHLGEVDTVFHEILSDTVHIDVHHVKPTAARPFHTLVTSGMSDLPMRVPENIDAPRFLELMITLPADWAIGEAAFKDEQWYWPVRELKFLARFPHKFDTWLGFGHTLPNGDPAQPFAPNTRLNGVIILPPVSVPEDFHQLPVHADKTIRFMSVVPLYQEEMDFKLRKGSDELLDRFDRDGITDVVAVDRPNCCRKRFGFF